MVSMKREPPRFTTSLKVAPCGRWSRSCCRRSGVCLAGDERVERREALARSFGGRLDVINDDPYDKGWIVRFEPPTPADLDELMDAGEYEAFVAGGGA